MSPQDLPPGTLFAEDFQILRRLGVGDNGAVYVAEQISTGAQRALKVVAPHVAPDERARLAFEQEARIGALIESEHTVLVVGAGLDSKTRMAWVAMELLDGVDLSSRFGTKAPLAHDEVALLFGQLGSALGAAHAVGIAHGDLKPSNVFLARARSGDGGRQDPFCVKVLDFGVARLTLDPASAAAGVRGTPLWMAPEQAQPGGIVGPAADVWAFGLMAFHALTGKPYWRAASAPTLDLSALVREITTEPLEPATERAASLGLELRVPGFDAWLARCLEREPGLRFESGEAARIELGALLGRPWIARPSSLPPSDDPAAAAPPRPQSWLGSTVDRPAGDTSWFTAAAPGAPLPPPATSESLATARPNVAAAEAGTVAASIPQSTPGSSFPSEPEPRPPPKTARAKWPLFAVAGLGLATFVLLASRWRADTRSASPPATASAPITSPAISAFAIPVAADSVDPRAAQTLLDQARAHATVVSFEGGSFAPGSLDGPRDERPGPKEKVPAFAIELHEVTVQDYALCVSAGTCSPAGTGAMCLTDGPQNALSPVNCVSWKQARAYCEWIGRRLPTEAEWELAAGGAGKRTYPWARGAGPGGKDLCWQRCKSSEGPCPVGAFAHGATPEGLVDMAGNVEEWTASPYCPYDQPDCGSEYRVTRGGGWCDSDPSLVRASARRPHPPNEVSANIGMRCAVGR